MTAKYDRMTVYSDIMNGQPCIRGMRLTVRRVVEAVALYPDRTELMAEYPELEDEDIRQALEFAANNLDDQVLENEDGMTKVLLDQGLPRSSVIWLRQAGWDAVHVYEMGLSRARDKDILNYARAERRTCITLDADFHAIVAVGNDKQEAWDAPAASRRRRVVRLPHLWRYFIRDNVAKNA